MDSPVINQLQFVKSIYTWITLLLVWFLLPVLSVPILCMFAAFIDKGRVLIYFILAITFGLIAYTAQSIGVEQTDLVRYSQAHLKMASINNLNDLLVSQVVIAGEINALYIILSFTLAKIFPNHPQTLMLFWVSVSYFFIFLSFHEFLKVKDLKRDSYFLYLLFIVVLGIPFSQTVETIKQCASAGILSYAIMLRVNKRKKSWVFAICSVLIHMSSLMIFPVFLFINSRSPLKYWVPIFVLAFAMSFFNIVELLNNALSMYMGAGLKERGEVYAEYGWELSRRYNLILFVYFLAVVILIMAQKHLYKFENNKNQVSSKIDKLVTVQFVAFIILLLNRSNIHNFVRYTLCYYPFFILSILSFDFFKFKKNEKAVLWVAFLFFFALMNITLLGFRTDITTGYANSYLDNSFVKFITYSVFDILKFNVNG